MNLIDLYVTEVLEEPRYKFGYWMVEVMANGYGHISQTTVYCDSKEEALKVQKGYKFQG